MIKINDEALAKLSVIELHTISQILKWTVPTYYFDEVQKEINKRIKLIFPDFNVAFKPDTGLV